MSRLSDLVRNIRACYYLKKCSKKTHKNDYMKVAFIVQQPMSWDKQEPIFLELKSRHNAKVDILVVPSFAKRFSVGEKYGEEWEFFSSRYAEAKMVVSENGVVKDIAKEGYDYIFYQTPYNEHVPTELSSKRLVKFTKICYIPYGFSGPKVFFRGDTNSEFFRNVYFWFGDIVEVREILVKKFSSNVKRGLQKFLLLGYPVFEKYNAVKSMRKINFRILWTPRWSYDAQVGGSHFLEFKDNFINLSKKYSDDIFSIRPHPLMFSNFIKEGRITLKEKAEYIQLLKDNDIFLSEYRTVDEDFDNTDILITDFSSIIPMFYLTGKPIIYCESHIDLGNTWSDIKNSMYVAKSWEDVERYINCITSGNDYLREDRLKAISKFKEPHINSSKKIVDTLMNDWKSSRKSD